MRPHGNLAVSELRLRISARTWVAHNLCKEDQITQLRPPMPPTDANSGKLMNSNQPSANDRQNRPSAITFASRVRIASGIRGKDRGHSKPTNQSDSTGNDSTLECARNRSHSRSSSRTSSFSSASSFSVALRPPAAIAPHASNVPCKASLGAVVTTKNAKEFLANMHGPVRQRDNAYQPRPPKVSSSTQGCDDRDVYDDRSPLQPNASHNENGNPPQYPSILKNRNEMYGAISRQFPPDPNIYNDNENGACPGFMHFITTVSRLADYFPLTRSLTSIHCQPSVSWNDAFPSHCAPEETAMKMAT